MAGNTPKYATSYEIFKLLWAQNSSSVTKLVTILQQENWWLQIWHTPLFVLALLSDPPFHASQCQGNAKNSQTPPPGNK